MLSRKCGDLVRIGRIPSASSAAAPTISEQRRERESGQRKGRRLRHCSNQTKHDSVGDHDPARGVYKMAYWYFVKQDAKDVPGLCVAVSPDGIHWTKHPRAPLLKAAYGVPSQPPFDGELAGEPLIRPAISDVIDLMYDPQREVFVSGLKLGVMSDILIQGRTTG